MSKKYLSKQKELLDHNLRLLEYLVAEYEDCSAGHILSLITSQFAEIPEEYFLTPMETENIKNKADTDIWSTRIYEQSQYMKENKKMITSHGLRVRSKSEVLIAEKFYENKVEFHYEEILHIGQEVFVPDFTIKADNGDLIYWEHCGMTGNQSYMRHHNMKIKKYEKIGIVPWKNLIITYDDENGNIDLAIVDSEIKNKILNKK